MDFLERARAGLKQAMAKRDRLIVHVVGTINDNNKAANLLFERLSEWYAVYFPELKLPEPKKYCEFILAFDRDNPDFGKLIGIVGKDRASSLEGKARGSLGVNLKPEDLEALRETARKLLGLYELREELEQYQAVLVQETCPNLAHLLDPGLAAKLVARAGSVERLAKMPASTVQVLGAEKALFKHLKKHSKPPKHGLIFQHPYISTSPKKQRGRIARTLSGKIAIAAKADAYTGNFIAEKLKEDFQKRVNAIRGA
jgi:nucleolar protein 56